MASAAPASGLTPLSFADLPGFDEDDLAEAFAVFRRSCLAIVEGRPPLRAALAPSPALVAVCRRALALDSAEAEARRFFETNFRPFRAVSPQTPREAGFFTAYYEPVVDGALTQSPAFAAPVLSPPRDGSPRDLPARAAIEAGALDGSAKPIVWLRDKVEVFLAQVQGSARVRLEDGRLMRLVYAGRNGWPYTSIGRILIESGEITEAGMSLAALKAWIRSHGQEAGEAGATLMQRNQSYVFFAEAALDTGAGPIGGEGLSLTALRSLAVDRNLYAYGSPVWIDIDLAWAPGRLRRLMIAQDTGSAIVGPARADLFLGSGDEAGTRAGGVRHAGDFVVFLPVEEGFQR